MGKKTRIVSLLREHYSLSEAELLPWQDLLLEEATLLIGVGALPEAYRPPWPVLKHLLARHRANLTHRRSAGHTCAEWEFQQAREEVRRGLLGCRRQHPCGDTAANQRYGEAWQWCQATMEGLRVGEYWNAFPADLRHTYTHLYLARLFRELAQALAASPEEGLRALATATEELPHFRLYGMEREGYPLHSLVRMAALVTWVPEGGLLRLGALTPPPTLRLRGTPLTLREVFWAQGGGFLNLQAYYQDPRYSSMPPQWALPLIAGERDLPLLSEPPAGEAP